MAKLMALVRPKKDVDMTEGPIAGHLIRFAIPLLLGNLFQQLYNMVDTWVVGNYVSKEAFAAVGTVGPIINMLIGFFLGLSSGAGVVISQYYGAKKYDKVRDTVHTAVLMTLLLGVAFTFVGIGMTPFMLRMMKTPDSVLPQSTAYLTIYFAGVIGLMVYNIGAGILRAIGDSRRPFYFLVVSALMNTVLDLLFVLVFHMGVEGVALATVIAQGTSAVLIMITLLRTDTCVKVSLLKLRFHGDVLAKVFRVGIPAALQMTITSFSNVFVQSYINYFGDACMGGWTAYAKVDQLMFLPMQSLSLASTTFVGQNLGIDRVERAKRGVSLTLLLSLASTAIIMVPLIAAAPYTVAFFNDDPAVIEYGTLFLRYITPFYLLCCVNQVYSSALRGAGNSKIPMLVMLISFVGFRQVYLFIMANYISNTVLPIAMGYPAGWFVCSALIAIYYHAVPLNKKKLIQ